MSLYEEDLPVRTSPAHFSASPAATLESQRQIRPLGDQIIIRVLLPKSVGSIIIPDSAKGSTHQGEKGDFVHFVEAEVIAVGPGKRGFDPMLMDDLTDCLRLFCACIEPEEEYLTSTMGRARNRNFLIPLEVKAGDRILYHPAIQSFDRKINPELLGLKPEEGDCYIIGEHSVLGILDPED